MVSVRAAVEAGRTLGAEFDHAADTTTVFVQVDVQRAIAAGLLPAAGGNVGWPADLVLALKVRADDLRPLELALATTTQLSRNIDVPAVTAAMALASDDPDPGLLRALGEATGLLTHHDSVSVQSKATLDPTQPAEVGLAGDILTGLASRNQDRITSAGREIGEHLADHTAISVEFSTGTNDTLGFDVRGGAGVGGAMGTRAESSASTFIAAVDRRAGGSFAVRNCGTGQKEGD